ncbi:MAG: hypothetical protein WC383_11695 [Gammaproteobacteria bacterium]
MITSMDKDTKQLLLILAVGLGAPLLFFQDWYTGRSLPHDTERGEAVTAVTRDNTKQTDHLVETAEVSDWHGIDNLECVRTEGPVKLLQNLQTLNEPYTTSDKYVDGRVVEVTIEIPNRLAQVTYYRGREACESVAAGEGAKRRAELEKYR